ncbi:MAG: hypothetical protein H6560_23145 [Lewinellaceae bacterium]|nr:hypothetical protein [Lewinellaceae bacterium]
MKRLLLFCLFIGVSCYAPKAYIPKEGSKERKEIIDIFRKDFGEEKNKISVKVNHFSVNKNWACASVTPMKDNIEYAEPRWSLFNKVGGVWKEVNWSDGIDLKDDFELIDLPEQNGRVAKLIVKKYPSCPMDIFGK